MDRIFKKTIIHEIGHYTARTLNHEIYKIGEGVDKIEFEKKNAFEYEGRTIPIKPENYKESNPIINLPEYISIQFYGCIFQSLYLEEEFNNCFAIHKNGEKDVSAYSHHTNDLAKEKKMRISKYFREHHIPKLKSNKEHFAEIFDKDYSNLLRVESFGYTLEMNELRKELDQFLIKHTSYYNELIIKIRTIIQYQY